MPLTARKSTSLCRRAATTLALGATLLCVATGAARGQSLAFGAGSSFPIPSWTYVEGEVSREFRVTPQPGYYPILQERSNANFGTQLYVSLVLDDVKFLGFLDSLELRIDFAELGWEEARVTHTAIAPTELVGGRFDDATAEYLPLEDACWLDAAGAPQCLLQGDYDSQRNISALALPALRLFGITTGGRYSLLNEAGWRLWGAPAFGLAIATFVDPGSEFYFGLDLGAGVGVSVALGRVVSLELETRGTFILTEAPDTLQNRLNHGEQGSGGVFGALMETFAWVDVHVGLRFNLGAF